MLRTARVSSCAALACAVLLAVAGSAGAAVYGGTSGDGLALGAVTNRAGTQLQRLHLHLEGTCDDGQPLFYRGTATRVITPPQTIPQGLTVFTAPAIGPGGRVTATGVGTGDYGTRVGSLQFTLAAQIRRGTLTGTVQGTVSLTDRAGQQPPITCRFAPVPVSARSSAGIVYAGSTTESEPVVLRLDRRRRAVRRLLVGWAAGCKPSGQFAIPDDLRNFPLGTTGRFGDVFDIGPLDLGAGAKRTVTYQIAGRIRGARASGTLKVGVRDVDANGAPTTTCGPQSIRFSAATTVGR
jgi:hypothetical protein